jgi:hypothetical protein
MFEPALLYHGYVVGRLTTGVGILLASISMQIIRYRLGSLVSLFDEFSHSVEVIVFDIISFETEEECSWIQPMRLLFVFEHHELYCLAEDMIPLSKKSLKKKFRYLIIITKHLPHLYREGNDWKSWKCILDREIGNNSTIDEMSTIVYHRGKYSWNTDRCTNCIDNTPFDKYNLFTRIDIGCDDFERDIRIREFLFPYILFEELRKLLSLDSSFFEIYIEEFHETNIGGNLFDILTRISTSIKSTNKSTHTRTDDKTWGKLEFFQPPDKSDMSKSTSCTTTEDERELFVCHILLFECWLYIFECNSRDRVLGRSIDESV